MSKKLAKILRTEMSASLPVIAKILESKGRNRDKILAHINEDEAELLRMHGGSGTINPETGLMEFDDGGTTSYYGEAGEYKPETSYYGSAGEGMPAAQRFEMPTFDYSSYGGGYYGDSVAPPVSAPSYTTAGAPSTGQEFITGVPSTFAVAPPPAPSLGPAPTGADLTAGPAKELGMADRLANALGIDKEQLYKLGMGGVQGIAGILQSRQAAAQGQQAKKELGALAKPYRERGQQMLTAAERGELTPVGQQQLQAMQARLAQGVEQRGGVGVAQAQAQINAYRDQLIQAQYDLGLKVLNIADNIAAGAIKTGLQADQYVNELTSNYMTNIARTLSNAPPQIMTREGVTYG